MKTLDRYILRNFLTAVLLWFVVVVALRVVADLFVNMDEWTERQLPLSQMMADMGRFYGNQFFLYIVEMGGLIIVASAAFSLARMNHSNELTAMLASGMSLYRVIWPIVLCSMLLGGGIILDREIIIPRISAQLVRSRDDLPGTKRFPLNMLTDAYRKTLLPPFQGVTIKGSEIVSGPLDYGMLAVAALVCVLVAAAGYAYFNSRKWVFAERV